jgi:glycosyltransferase involved in cell wall biosynthesis
MKIAIDARAYSPRFSGGWSLYEQKVVAYLLGQEGTSLLLLCRPSISLKDFLLEKDFSHRVTIEHIGPDAEPAPTEENYGIDTQVIPAKLREHQVGLYHACSNWGIGFQDGQIATVLTLHDVIPFAIKEGPYAGDQFKVYEKMVAESVRNADQVVTVSHYSRQEIVKKLQIPPGKIEVIYNGCDPAKLEPGGECEFLQTYRINPREYFIYVGGFYGRKNVIRMVQAFRSFLREHPDFSLVLTGDNQSNEYIRSQFARFTEEIRGIEQRVHFAGFVSREELDQFIANSAALIYPSIYEGFGLPIIEAMNLGVPALGADNTVLPEIGKDAVVYFDPFDVCSIGKAMSDIVRDPELRAEKITLGKEQARQFSWDQSCRQLFEIYQSLYLV